MRVRTDQPDQDQLDSTNVDVDDDIDDDIDDDVVVLPWYRNPWNMLALVIAVLALGTTGGFVIGERNATPDPNSVDVGFLQDMRAHHEQAVEMSLEFIAKTGTNGTVSTIADEIAFGQSIDIGRMIQLLRDYGKPEAADISLPAMGWMGAPVPIDRMPGLATDADLQNLRLATGSAADQLFVKLMITHHEGGIHMAEYAAAHANTSEVKAMAASMVTGQQSEIVELQNFLAGKTTS